jgi:ABC-type glycerol-3-phosphate transport system substrate-binding protein
MLQPVLLPISTDVITPGKFEETYYPVMAQDLIRNGALRGIPLQIDTLALFTNTEILKAAGVEAPTSWVDFANTAARLTVKDEDRKIKTSGAAMGTADNVSHVEDIVSLLFVQNGVQLTRIGSAPQQAADALTFYTSFVQGGNGVWDDTLDPSSLAFSKGNLAMYFGYASDIPAIKAANPSLQFEVHPVPRLPGKKTTIASYWVEGASSKSKHPKEALMLLKYLTQKDVLERLYNDEVKAKQFGQLFPRKDMAEKLKDNTLLYPFVTQANDAISTPFSSDTQDSGLNAELNSSLRNAIRNSQNTVSQETLEGLIQAEAQAIGKFGQ